MIAAVVTLDKSSSNSEHTDVVTRTGTSALSHPSKHGTRRCRSYIVKRGPVTSDQHSYPGTAVFYSPGFQHVIMPTLAVLKKPLFAKHILEDDCRGCKCASACVVWSAIYGFGVTMCEWTCSYLDVCGIQSVHVSV